MLLSNHSFRYELCPASDVYFGYQQINTLKTLVLELKNIGKFPFCYTLAGLHEDFSKRPPKLKKEKEKSLPNIEKDRRSDSSKLTKGSDNLSNVTVRTKR